MAALPTIDLGPFRRDPSSDDARVVAIDLRDACHSPGFCYVTGHGVDDTIDAGLFAEMHTFFALDDRSGADLWHVNVGGPVHAGPMSFAVDGRQYVSISANQALFTFALPE